MNKWLPAIIGLYLLVYILPLGMYPAFTPDETRYAEIAREIVTTGDYAVPRVNGLLYFEKPVMGYWLNALSLRMFGENNFAIRFPSALAAGLTAALVYIISTGFAGGAAGLLSTGIFLTFLAVFAIGQFSVLDGMFSLFVTASMTAFWRADTADRQSPDDARKRLIYLLLFGTLAGLSFLVKGFVAFVIPVAAIVPYLIWEKRAKDILRIPWIPIGMAILVCLPWVVTVGLKAPDYWNFFIFHEHIQRFLGKNAQHSQPFWFFLMILPAMALPWTFLFPAAIAGMKQKGVNTKFIRYLICWFVFPFLFFSASKGKLATYVLPCFPPLAVLLAMGIAASAENSNGRYIKKGALAAGWVIAVVVTVFFISQTFGPFHFRPYDQTWKAAFAGSGLLIWAVLAFTAAKASTWRRQVTFFCLAPLAFLFAAHFTIPEKVLMEKAPEAFLMKYAQQISPETTIVSGLSLTTSACWYYKRSDVYVLGKAGELSYGLDVPDTSFRHLDNESFKNLVETQRARNGQVALVEEADQYAKIRQNLPDPKAFNTDGKFVFAVF